jgi:hypothetical protein
MSMLLIGIKARAPGSKGKITTIMSSHFVPLRKTGLGQYHCLMTSSLSKYFVFLGPSPSVYFTGWCALTDACFQVYFPLHLEAKHLSIGQVSNGSQVYVLCCLSVAFDYCQMGEPAGRMALKTLCRTFAHSDNLSCVYLNSTCG